MEKIDRILAILQDQLSKKTYCNIKLKNLRLEVNVFKDKYQINFYREKDNEILNKDSYFFNKVVSKELMNQKLVEVIYRYREVQWVHRTDLIEKFHSQLLKYTKKVNTDYKIEEI